MLHRRKHTVMIDPSNNTLDYNKSDFRGVFSSKYVIGAQGLFKTPMKSRIETLDTDFNSWNMLSRNRRN